MHCVGAITSSALVFHGSPYTMPLAFACNFPGCWRVSRCTIPKTTKPYVTDGNITFIWKSSSCIWGRNHVRRSKRGLDAEDLHTFATCSDHDILLSTCTPGGRSQVLQFMSLLRCRAWMDPVNDCHYMIIALHLSGWGTDTLKPLICTIHFTKSTIGLQIKD